MSDQHFGTALLMHLAEEQVRSRNGRSVRMQLSHDIANLSLQELQLLGGSWRHFCSIQVRPRIALQYLASVQIQVRTETNIRILIGMGAPFALLSRLCQLSWRKYKQLVEQRTGDTAHCSTGRPRAPNTEEEEQIRDAEKKIRLQYQRPLDEWTVTEWLALGHTTSQIPLKVSWGYLTAGDIA